MRLSVIIPCRNGEPYLGPTIESVLNQTRAPEEVIVVDDGSTDGSLERAQAYGGLVRAIPGPSGGASAARNRGMEAAAGEAVMFLDADDLLGPRALEGLEAALTDAPDSVACCPWYRLEEVAECWIAGPASCAPRRPGQDDLGAWLTGWYHPPCSVLWSRSAYERSGGWDPQVKVNTDGDVMMRGFIAGNRLVFAEDGAAYYRRLPAGQVSLSGTRNTRPGAQSRLFVLRRVAEMLREQGRLGRYRAPLGEAFAALAADCGGEHPDIRDACLLDASRIAGPSWLRRSRRIPARLALKYGRLRRRYGRAVGPVGGENAAGRARSAARAGGRRRAVTDAVGAAGAAGPGSRPKVSVVIPAYNRADLLPRALASVLKQDYEDFEILVVDDASTDGTARLMSAWRDPRIRYLRQEANGGTGAARNRGMRESSGEFIAFLDSDDEWLGGKLSRQVARFLELPRSVGLVYTGTETVDAAGKRKIDVPAHRGDLYALLLLRNVLVGGSCAMIRRSVIPTVGYFDETLPAIEDYEYWVRIARFYDIDFVEAPLVRYHDALTDGSAASRRSRDFAANFKGRDAFYNRNWHEMERLGVEHLFLLESAKRHLRWPRGTAETGRELLVRAVTKRPTALQLYPWLAYALLPPGTRPLADKFARRVVDLAPGRRGGEEIAY